MMGYNILLQRYLKLRPIYTRGGYDNNTVPHTLYRILLLIAFTIDSFFAMVIRQVA